MIGKGTGRIRGCGVRERGKEGKEREGDGKDKRCIGNWGEG